MQVLIFYKFVWKTPIHVPKVEVFGDLKPKWLVMSTKQNPSMGLTCKCASKKMGKIKNGYILPIRAEAYSWTDVHQFSAHVYCGQMA